MRGGSAGSPDKNHYITREEREAILKTGGGATYGEITQQGIAAFMSEIPFRCGNFVDLGSGRGNVAAYVAHTFNFDQCYAVEMSETRHKIAERILSEAKRSLPRLERVCLLCADLFSFDLSNIDVAFSDNLMFDEAGIKKMFDKVTTEMKPGSFFISVKAAPKGFDHLSLVRHLYVEASWSDQCPIYVYRLPR